VVWVVDGTKVKRLVAEIPGEAPPQWHRYVINSPKAQKMTSPLRCAPRTDLCTAADAESHYHHSQRRSTRGQSVKKSPNTGGIIIYHYHEHLVAKGLAYFSDKYAS